jgi:uracil phosphoribosyltransferase
MRPNVNVVEHPMVQEQLLVARNKDSNQAQFREALFEIGRCIAYEFLDTLETTQVTVKTPLGVAQGRKVKDADRIVLVLVLRAAIPFVEGILKVFPFARTAVVSAWREEPPKFRIKIEYAKLPRISKDNIVIFADPMLATGNTLRSVAEIVLNGKKPKRVAFFSAISTEPGINHVASRFPNGEFYTCATDPYIDDRGYIVPGLGDAGDRTFGVPA